VGLDERNDPLDGRGTTPATRNEVTPVVFSPSDQTDDERRSNERFASIRETDTTPVDDRMVRDLMRPTGNRGSIPRGRR
jgi:hypothetical protein